MKRHVVLGQLYSLPQQRVYDPKAAARARTRAALADIDKKLDSFRSIGEAARDQVEELRKRRRRLMAQLT
jgi:hypothetical protein